MPSQGPASAKPTRRHLTLQQKVLIIDKREREHWKQDELAIWAAAEFLLPSIPTQPTISNILKDKDKLREALRLNPGRHVKSVREVTCPQFEESMVRWLQSQENKLDRRAILDHAARTRTEYPRTKGLSLSDGWLTRLMERHRILRHTGGSEEGSVSAQEPPPPRSPSATTTRIERASHSRSPSEERRDSSSPPLGHNDLPYPSTVIHSAHSVVEASSASAAIHHPQNDQHSLEQEHIHDSVRDYYGRHLQLTGHLKTNASHCSLTPLNPIISDIIQCIPEEVTARYFGCGVPIPLGIEGLHVLDLGCGSGRDAYILSALVGHQGSVTGIDMTPEPLAIAKENVPLFTERLQRDRSSLQFIYGRMEHLDELGLEADTVDLVVSNFVLSLTPAKEKALKEIYRVLHTGGEFYFSDIYATRRLPDNVRFLPELHNEGLGGALYIDDFEALCRHVGFGHPRRVAIAPITIQDETVSALVGLTQFYSITYRCFKAPAMELRACEEDYGHVAKYLGTIAGCPLVYELDENYHFELRRPLRIGGNTAAVLKQSWLARHFKVDGDWSEHFGRFQSSTVAHQPTSTGWAHTPTGT